MTISCTDPAKLSLIDIIELDNTPPGAPIEGFMWPEHDVIKHFKRMEGSASYRIRVLGELCYCEPRYIREILERHGLVDSSSGKPKPSDVIAEYSDDMHALAKSGADAQEIGYKFGLGTQTVRTWMIRNGYLIPVADNTWRSAIRDDEAIRLYEAGATDTQAAEVFGVSRWAMGQWRKEHAVTTKRSLKRSGDIDGDKARQLYQDGRTDKAVAEVLGTTVSVMRRWRQRHNIDTVYGRRVKECKAARTPVCLN